MATLTIIRGLPGSGKSTLAKQMMTSNHKHFEADMYFVDSCQKYLFDHTKIKDAHNWCQNSVRGALSNGFDVIVSNTFVKKWEMGPYLNMTKDVNIITTTGNYENVHGVPHEVIERMRNNWEN